MPKKRGRVQVCCRKSAASSGIIAGRPVRGPFPDLEPRVERLLRDQFPIPAGVALSVRRVSPDVFVRQHGFACCGDCVMAGDHRAAWIRLASDLSQRELVDTLVHEWPHVLRYLAPTPGTPHDALYWQIHGQVYRAVFGD